VIKPVILSRQRCLWPDESRIGAHWRRSDGAGRGLDPYTPGVPVAGTVDALGRLARINRHAGRYCDRGGAAPGVCAGRAAAIS